MTSKTTRRKMKPVKAWALAYHCDSKILGLERWALDLHPNRRRARVALEILTARYGPICRIARVIITEEP